MAKNVAVHPPHFIREWRDFRGFTQEELADKIGMSTSTISQLEKGRQGYRQCTLQALARALGCSPGALLIRDPSREEDAIWSIWERLTPKQRRQATAILKTFADDVAA